MQPERATTERVLVTINPFEITETTSVRRDNAFTLKAYLNEIK